MIVVPTASLGGHLESIDVEKQHNFLVLSHATDLIGGGDRVTRVFVSALTQMNIDNSIHVSTSDNRLLRRILRDYNFRGYSADVTLNRVGVL